jgi:hypothetical protein
VLKSLTTGSNRSLRSLGRAKARPLTKRYVLLAFENYVSEKERFRSLSQHFF